MSPVWVRALPQRWGLKVCAARGFGRGRSGQTGLSVLAQQGGRREREQVLGGDACVA
jgi:hypothetical protein